MKALLTMDEKGNKRIQKVVYITTILVIFFLGVWGINRLNGPFIFDDEYGYWSNAAFIAGYKWQVNTPSWYSFGYSLLLVPLFHIFSSMQNMYHAAIVMNALMLVGIYIIAFMTTREIVPRMPFWKRWIAATTVACYSSYLSQSKIAWSEIFVYFLFWIIVYLFIRSVRTKRVFHEIVLSTLVGYLYYIHNRTIGVVVSYFCIIVFMLLKKQIRVRDFLSFILPSIFLLIIYSKIKNAIVETNPAIGNAKNTYDSVWSNITTIVSIKGLWTLLIGFLGVVWYDLAGSFLLVGWGILKPVKTIFSSNDKDKELIPFYLFIMLCFIAMVGVTSVFFLRDQINIVDGTGTRFDTVIYGRYNESCIGIFLLLGCIFLLTEEIEKKWRYFISILFLLFGIGYILNKLYIMSNYGYNTFCVPAIFWSGNFVSRTPLAITVFTVLISLTLYLFVINARGKKRTVLSVMPFVLIILLNVLSASNYLYGDVTSYQSSRSKSKELVKETINVGNVLNTKSCYVYPSTGGRYRREQADLYHLSLIPIDSIPSDENYIIIYDVHSLPEMKDANIQAVCELGGYVLGVHGQDYTKHLKLKGYVLYESDSIQNHYSSDFKEYMLLKNGDYRFTSEYLEIPVIVKTSNVHWKDDVAIGIRIFDADGELVSSLSQKRIEYNTEEYIIKIRRSGLSDYLKRGFSVEIQLAKDIDYWFDDYIEPLPFNLTREITIDKKYPKEKLLWFDEYIDALKYDIHL